MHITLRLFTGYQKKCRLQLLYGTIVPQYVTEVQFPAKTKFDTPLSLVLFQAQYIKQFMSLYTLPEHPDYRPVIQQYDSSQMFPTVYKQNAVMFGASIIEIINTQYVQCERDRSTSELNRSTASNYFKNTYVYFIYIIYDI